MQMNIQDRWANEQPADIAPPQEAPAVLVLDPVVGQRVLTRLPVKTSREQKMTKKAVLSQRRQDAKEMQGSEIQDSRRGAKARR